MITATLEPVENKKLPQYLQPPFPTVFTLEITQRCHHYCLGCGNVFNHTAQEMDVFSWRGILNKLRPYIQALRITGGEPTLHKQFDDIIRYIDTLGVPFVIFTNGNWTKPHEVIETLLSCSHLQGLLISLHGADAGSYQKFVKKDAFHLVTQNIQLAARAGLHVATNTLLLTSTFAQINTIVELAFSLGVATASFGRYYGPVLPGLSLTEYELRQSLVQIATLHSKDPRITVSNCIPACFLPDENFGGRGCTSGFTHCTIGPLGAVRPCTHTPMELGSIQNDDIETIWQGSLLSQWRQRIPSLCLSCAVLSACRGGCRATAQQLELATDPLMTAPLSEAKREVTVELNAHDCPVLACQIERTNFGYALNGMGHYITLSQSAGPILYALDGTQTIEHLQEGYGDGCLQLIGSLVSKRLVTMA